MIVKVPKDCNDQEERRNLPWEIYVVKSFIKNIALDDNEELADLKIVLKMNRQINEEKTRSGNKYSFHVFLHYFFLHSNEKISRSVAIGWIDLVSIYYFSAITNISKSLVVNLSFLEKAPNVAPNISIALKLNDFRSQVISDGT